MPYYVGYKRKDRGYHPVGKGKFKTLRGAQSAATRFENRTLETTRIFKKKPRGF